MHRSTATINLRTAFESSIRKKFTFSTHQPHRNNGLWWGPGRHQYSYFTCKYNRGASVNQYLQVCSINVECTQTGDGGTIWAYGFSNESVLCGMWVRFFEVINFNEFNCHQMRITIKNAFNDIQKNVGGFPPKQNLIFVTKKKLEFENLLTTNQCKQSMTFDRRW